MLGVSRRTIAGWEGHNIEPSEADVRLQLHAWICGLIIPVRLPNEAPSLILTDAAEALR